MAILVGNSIFKGYSGKFGTDFVIRNYNGKSVICKYPAKRTKPPTDKQIATTNKFAAAVNYAKMVVQDPVLSAFYNHVNQKKQSIYRMAVRDFLNSPIVELIDYKDYCGNKGDVIRILVTDVIAAVKVKVSIIDKAGNLIEEGDCFPDLINTVWVYKTSVTVKDTSSVSIKATALNTPGNTGESSVTVL